MTQNAARLNDEHLRRALIEMAGSPDSDALLTDVLRIVDAQAQVARRPWTVGRWRRSMLMLVAVLLVAGAIGATIALSQPDPEPQPSPSPQSEGAISVPDFVVPFTYHVPVGGPGKLGRYGPKEPAVIYARVSGSRKLQLFLVNGVHDCEEGREGMVLDRDPTSFLEGLHELLGVGMGRIGATTLGNLPAVAADIDPQDNTCLALHEDRLGLGYATKEPHLSRPGRLIIADAGTQILGVYISAPTKDELAEWMPMAQAYVNSFVFPQTEASDGPTPSAQLQETRP